MSYPDWLKKQNDETLAELSRLPNAPELILEGAADWLEKHGWFREPAREAVLRFAKRREGIRAGILEKSFVDFLLSAPVMDDSVFRARDIPCTKCGRDLGVPRAPDGIRICWACRAQE